MKKKIIFWGGTGQAKVMRPVADIVGVVTAVFDDTKDLKSPFLDIPFFHGNEFNSYYINNGTKKLYFSVTVGNPHGQFRRDKSKELIDLGLSSISLIDKSSVIQSYTKIGIGSQIHPLSIINSFAEIGDYCIINTRALVEHDGVLEDGVEIGPGAVLCGEVYVGENTWIGAGSVVRERIKIGKNVIVGAGAVVVKDVPDNQIVVGVPAKPIRRSNNG